MVLVKHDLMVVHTSDDSTSSWMLPVLIDTAMSGAHYLWPPTSLHHLKHSFLSTIEQLKKKLNFGK